MRRLLAAAALAALCATAAACGSGTENSPGGSGSTTGAATEAAGASNTKQICADAERVITDSTAKFTEEMTKAMTAAATGDKTASDQAVTTVKAMFTQWADGLREQAGKATDAELKSALNDAADQIAKVAASITSINDLQEASKLLDAPEAAAASKKLEQLCP